MSSSGPQNEASDSINADVSIDDEQLDQASGGFSGDAPAPPWLVNTHEN